MKKVKLLVLSIIFCGVIAFLTLNASASGAQIPVIGSPNPELKVTSSISGAYPLPNQTPAPGQPAAHTPAPTPSAGAPKSSPVYDDYESYDNYTSYDYYLMYTQSANSGGAATAPSPAPGQSPSVTTPAATPSTAPAPATTVAAALQVDPSQPQTPAGAADADNAAALSSNGFQAVDTESNTVAAAADNAGPSGDGQLSTRLIELINANMPAGGGSGSAGGGGTQAGETADAEAANAEVAPETAETSPDGSLQALINITNPNGDDAEAVYKNTYAICGVRDDGADPDEPIIVFMTRYNAETGQYEAFSDIDGEEQWTVGANGVFIRNILLEEGENHFAIAAYKASAMEAARAEGRMLEARELQVLKFTILYRSQNVAEKISELFKELTIANILKEIENS